MVESLLNLNIASFTGKVDESSAYKKADIGNSMDFSKIFSDVNKSYVENNNFSDTSVNQSYSDKNVEKENFNRTEEKNSGEEFSKIKDKNEKENEEFSKKTEENDKKDEEGKEENSENKSKKQVEKTDENLPQQVVVQKQAVQDALVQAVVGQVGGQSLKTQNQEPAVDSEKVLKTDSKVDVDLSKLSKNIKDLTDAKSTQVKIQSETQQVLLNLKADSKENVEAVGQKLAEDVKVQAPVIQASAKVAEKAAAKSSAKKENLMEMLEKSVLNQEILDKTNATVVSVESSASGNSGNLLNHQNAQEQGVKFSLESNSSGISGQTNVSGQNTPLSFDKRLEGVQQPKEINKADILSQIHTKMEQLEEGGTTKVTIVLKPENLGKINLELINSKEGFTARLTAENSQVKDLLDKNLDSLKSSLASQGVNVNNVTVKVADVEKQTNDMFSFNQNQSESDQGQAFGNSNDSGGSYDESGNYGFFDEESMKTAESVISEETAGGLVHNGQVDYKI